MCCVQVALVEVARDSEEFKFVEERFREGGVDATGARPELEFTNAIVKVERVQNMQQWELYFARRREVAKANGGDPNEL